MGWDPGSRSGKNLFRILDSGVKKAPDPGSEQHWKMASCRVSYAAYLDEAKVEALNIVPDWLEQPAVHLHLTHLLGARLHNKESRFFLLFLHDDRRIQIRIHTSD
jgi:hypothetical protein